MKILYLFLTYLLSALLIGAITYTPLFDTTVLAQSPEIQTVPVSTTVGRIVKKENNTIFVEADDKTVTQFAIPENVTVKKNTQESSIADLNTNDHITVTHTQNNQVLSVGATSGEVFDTSKILIPALGLGLLILAGLYMARKKATQPAIKTT